jgi:peptidoglycan/LPS O-acetylase OafA/YrhL
LKEPLVPHLTKRIDIQVLRGISVISVFLYHFNNQTFPNGFLGVDIFFLISGLLVCGQLDAILGKTAKNNLTGELREYFKRRLLRILPALTTFLIFAMAFTTLFYDSASNSQFTHLKHSIQAILNIYNFDLLKHSSDYFKSEDPLLNLWSLSVEVQTYLIFTLLSIVIVRVATGECNRQKIFRITVFVTSIVSALLCIAVIEYSSYFQELGLENLANSASFTNFYSPLSRLWEFCLGGMIGFYSRQSNPVRILKGNLSKNFSLGFLALLLLIDTPGNKSLTLLLMILVALLFLGSVDYSQKNRTLEFLEWIGNRSYSIYLYHLICLNLVNRVFRIDSLIESVFLVIAAGSLSVLLGNISFMSVEQRFNSGFHGTRKFNNTSFKLIGTFGSIGALGATAIVIMGTVLPSPDNSDDWVSSYAASNTKTCPLGHPDEPCELINGFSENWLLVGDSHAGALQLALAQVAKSQNTNLLTWNQCLFFDPELLGTNERFFPEWCLKLNKDRFTYLKRAKISALFVAYQYSAPTLGDSNMSNDFYEELIAKSIDRVPSEIQVFEFSQVPEYRDSIRLNSRFGYEIEKEDSVLKLSNANIFKERKPIRNREKYKWIDLSSAFCSKGICTRFKGDWLYVDDNHLSIRGADQTIPFIRAALGIK